MTTQKALWLPHVGAQFELGENEIPMPGPGQVLVELKAAAINPIDWRIQKEGFFLVNNYPAIIGENGSGVVTKVGGGVTNLVIGDRVTFSSPFDASGGGTYQQYCLADAQLTSKLPENVSFDEAAPITVCLTPFAVATYGQQSPDIAFTSPVETEGLGKYAHQGIVIMGGACSVGQYAIQLAKLSGFNPIITTASLKNKDLLLSLGATHVLDRKLTAAALKEQVANAMKAPVPYIFDACSVAETQQVAYDVLAPGGTLAIVTEAKVKKDEASQKNVFVVYGSFHLPQNRALGIKFTTALTKWLAEGKIKPNPIQVLPGGLHGIVDGLKQLETSEVSAKKFVVRPSETRA